MGGSDIGRAIADAIFAMVVTVGIVCVAIGALAVWGIPKLWAWIKPFLHSLTA